MNTNQNMTAAERMAALKQAYSDEPQQNQNQNFPNNYYPFWSMSVGQKAVIRFLPDLNENNPRGFLVEKVYHTLVINGQQRKIPCLSMYGEECPICKISQAYYKMKDEINGKKYWKKKQYIGQALVIEDPLPSNLETNESHQGKVKLLALGYQIVNIIKEAFASDELESIPYDFAEGYDFIIKKSAQGGKTEYATYAVGTKFANKPRSLTEAELAVVEEGMIDLSSILPKNPGSVKVQAMLDAEMNGEPYNEVKSSFDSDLPIKPTKPSPLEDNSEELSNDTNVDEMLSEIRNRRKKTT
jgi:hypothetical protein